ncbi:MAG: hypothetical protein H6897_08235 [Rhodobacteraceae bacterium]|nr:hypothetical protein [Paracoccaceae bacterium]MCC0069899.1 hypothetical protein [Paracoccaceae bacterium]
MRPLASDIDDAPHGNGAAPPPELRFLKLLVTALAGTMIAGLITIIVLLVIRLPSVTAVRPNLPEHVVLPDGLTAEAVTFGRGWIAVVTDTEEILILDAETGALRQRVAIGGT